jgi:hypothetical protein
LLAAINLGLDVTGERVRQLVGRAENYKDIRRDLRAMDRSISNQQIEPHQNVSGIAGDAVRGSLPCAVALWTRHVTPITW